MPPTRRTPTTKSRAEPRPAVGPRLDAAGLLAELKNLSDARTRDELGPRYGIVAAKAFGVPMAKIQALAKRAGTDHALALALWDTGWYEARRIAADVDDPAVVTSSQMDRWSRGLANWAAGDTVRFNRFNSVVPNV